MSPEDRDSKVTSPREQFVTTLPRRLEALAQGAVGLRKRPDSETNRTALIQRLEALREAALVLELDSFASAMSDALIALAGDTLDASDLDLLDDALSAARRVVTALTPSILEPPPIEIASVAAEPAEPERVAVAPAAPEPLSIEPVTLAQPVPAVTVAPESQAPAQTSAQSVSTPVDVTPAPRARTARGGARQTENTLEGRRILVGDDDAAVVWHVSSTLRRAGATVIDVGDGLLAWQRCLESAPDLVVCDVMMPRLDGFALCRSLKRDVVLADVPVVLLSWREDLLQRARELGAQADGYLAKDSAEHVLIARCEEALGQRTVLEARFEEDPNLQGRLDGLTPRFVLGLAARSGRALVVEFSDAGFAYEAHFDDGALIDAVRKGDEGTLRGEAVLPGLLGVRAGRFSVRPGEGTRAQLKGNLERLLEPHVQRTRATCQLVRSAELARVMRLELDPKVVGAYRAASPPVARQIVDALLEGVAPAGLQNGVSASLLEEVLIDLAIRGAIVAARDEAERDLLQTLEPLPVDARLQTPAPPKARPSIGTDVVFSERLSKRTEWQDDVDRELGSSPRPESPPRSASATAVEAPTRQERAPDPAPPVSRAAENRVALPTAPVNTAPAVLDFDDVLIAQLSVTPGDAVPTRSASPAHASPAAVKDTKGAPAAKDAKPAFSVPKGVKGAAASGAAASKDVKVASVESNDVKAAPAASKLAEHAPSDSVATNAAPVEPKASASESRVKPNGDAGAAKISALVATLGRVVAGWDAAKEKATTLLSKTAAWSALDLDAEGTPSAPLPKPGVATALKTDALSDSPDKTSMPKAEPPQSPKAEVVAVPKAARCPKLRPRPRKRPRSPRRQKLRPPRQS